jgi:SAM-dependent methyltransferase
MSTSKAVAPDFAGTTALPRPGATHMQTSTLRTRCAWAAEYTAGKDVLEVGCGAGFGLEWLAERARRIVAGEKNCQAAHEAHRGTANLRIEWMDAMELPCEPRSFDVVLVFEAQYYLENVPRFLAEAQRVLRPGGTLLISTVNCAWDGFHPSFPHTRNWTEMELLDALGNAGFETRVCAGFLGQNRGGHDLRRGLKAMASNLGYLPRSRRTKATGELIPAGDGIDLTQYRTLYFEARSCQ